MAKVLVSSCLLLVVLLGMRTVSDARALKRLPQPVQVGPRGVYRPTAACLLLNHNDTAAGYYPSFLTGDRIASYINPAKCGGTAQYPFEIQSVSLTMYGDSGAVWPVQVAVEFWTAGPNDSCLGPITLIRSDTVTLSSSIFEIPNIGTITFSTPICVSAPFFVAIKYTGATASPFPSINFDSRLSADSCSNWGFEVGYPWSNWAEYWSPPLPGNPIIWVEGQTQASYCTGPACCIGTTGNVDGLGIVDLGDLSALVSYLTGSGYVLPCYAAANVNATGIVDLGDLTALVSYLTGSGYVLPACP